MDGIYEEIKLLLNNENEILSYFLFHLLVHYQYNIAWELFNDKEKGELLKNKYKPLYFAVSQLVNNKESKINKLKIPPEIKETVENIIIKIDSVRKDYY